MLPLYLKFPLVGLTRRMPWLLLYFRYTSHSLRMWMMWLRVSER
ncbi:hypothetical protein C5167_016696 [Papaver somniferum]|nr:hypothetical protein C5167_016696 [Papaver somniferum]